MKKVLAWILAMAMLLGSVPVNAVHVHATEVEEFTETAVEETPATEPESVPAETEAVDPVVEETTEEAVSATLGSADDFALTVNAEPQVLGNGTCGSSVNWTMYDSGLLEITGSGDMYIWQSSTAVPWHSYRDQITSVTVGSGITSIGVYAFYNCTNLSSVKLPASITSIGEYAFRNCTALELVDLGAITSLTYIGTQALYNSGVKYVSIPQNVYNIGMNAFGGCANLWEITVSPYNSTYTSYYGVLFSADMTTLYQYPGKMQSITNGVTGAYTIPEGVENIWHSAFSDCINVTEIIFPESLKYIGQSAFSGCTNLTKLELPGNLWKIDTWAFSKCKLDYIQFPVSLWSVESYAFSNASVGVVYYQGTQDQWNGITFNSSNGAVQNNSNLYYRAYGSCGENVEYKIRDGVLTISGEGPMTDYASYSDVPWYANKAKITAVVIEDGVTSIGDYAFYNHEQVSSVSIGKDVKVIGKDAFNYCNLADLTNIALPDGLTTIKNNAFWGCTKLTSMTIPASVTSIGASAFKYCDRLATITFKGDFPNMAADGEQFYNLPALKVYYPANNTTWTQAVLLSYGNTRTVTWTATCGGTHVYDDAVTYTWAADNSTCTAASLCTNTGCQVGTKQTVSASVQRVEATCGQDGSIAYTATFTTEGFEAQSKYETIPATGEHSFGDDNICTVCGVGQTVASGTCGENLTWKLDVNGVLTISGTGAMTNYTDEDYAPWYDYWESITTVVLLDGVTSIGNYAFRGCGKIVEAFLADSVTDIGARAFWSCASLQSINIPEGVGRIFGYTFSGCSGLTSISLPSTLNEIDDHAFTYAGLTHITIPDRVYKIGNYAFYMSDLQTVTIGKGVSSLYAQAFAFCSNLKTVTFTGSAPSSGESTVFRKSSGKVTIYYPAGNTSWTASARACIESYSANWVAYCMEHDFSAITYTWAEDYSTCTAVSTCANGCEDVTGATETVTATVETTLEPTCATPGSKTYTATFTTEGFEPQTQSREIPATGIHTFDETNHMCECGLIGGKCGENLTWILDGTTFTVSGTGAMTDYPNQTAPWYNMYNTQVKTVVIEDGVTTIGQDAFYDFTNLTSVTIPDSVTSIGGNAFRYCTSLKAVDLPDDLVYLGSSAFYCCTALTELVIPDGVTALYSETFGYCKKMESITLPANLKSIGQHTFNHCESLKTLVIPDSCTSIADYAFMYCYAMTDIQLPKTLPSIGAALFYGCASLESVTIPNSVMAIDQRAFEGCVALKEITIPDTVYSIEWNTFFGCSSLETIVLSKNLMSIDMSAFGGCTALTELTIPASVTALTYSLFDNKGGPAKIVFLGDAPSFEDDTFTYLTTTCYYYNDTAGWTDEVKQNYGGEITWVGQCRTHNFDETTHQCVCGLIGGTCGENLTWTLIDGVLTISGTGDMQQSNELPWYDYRTQIKSVNMEKGITSIAVGAFEDCMMLTEVTIPDSVTKIWHSAFLDCSALTEIELPDSITELDAIFGNCTSLSSVKLPSGITYIASSMFSNCKSLTQITIPDSVTTIENSAFSSCWGLTSIMIPDSVKTIEAGAFGFCSKLSSVKLPSGLTMIADATFQNCTTLSNIQIPESVTYIGSEAFSGCHSLETISIPSGVVQIDTNAFNNCVKLSQVDLCEGLVKIGDRAFNYCSSLSEVIIPASVTSIGELAFYATDLDTVTFLGDAPTIAENAFTKVTANCYYYADTDGWTDEVKQNYGGTITWLATCGDHVYSEESIVYTWATGNASCTATWNCANEGCEVVKETETVEPSVVRVAADCVNPGSIIWTAEFTSSSFATQTQTVQIPTVAHTYTDTNKCTVCGYLSDLCGKELTWTFDGSTLTISGTGPMYNFGAGEAPWNDIREQIQNVTINEGVTSVGNNAFWSCTQLQILYLPETITSIGDYAFIGCISLYYPELEKTQVTSVGVSAFEDCRSMSTVDTPDTLQTIGTAAFYGCTGLYNILISESVTSIGHNAFGGGCSAGASITFKGNAPAFHQTAFAGTTLTAYYPLGNTTWTEDVLQNYGGELTWIASCGDHNFDDANFVYTWAEDFSTCTAQWLCANEGCQVHSIYAEPETVSATVKTVDGTCTQPGSITYTADFTFWRYETQTEVIETSASGHTEAEAVNENTVDATCVSTGSYDSVVYCAVCGEELSRETVVIPVTDHNFGEDHVCTGCGLIGGVYGENVIWTLKDNTLTFSGTGQMYGYSTENLPWYNYRSMIKHAVVEEGVTNVGSNTFTGCSELKDVVLSDTVTDIGYGAFQSCQKLESVEMSENLTFITAYAFSGCYALKSIVIPDGVTQIDTNTFRYCISLQSVTLSKNLQSIGQNAFASCSALTSITIPDTVTTIGRSAFSGCTSLTELTLPNKLTTINEGAFENCSGVTELVIPESVITIGDYAFTNMNLVTELVVPAKVLSIGTYAFSGWSSLTSLKLPEGLLALGNWVFSDCSALTQIQLPDSLQTMGYGTFDNCSSLTGIVIPEDTEINSERKFRGCTSLTSVRLPGTMTELGYEAFERCSSLVEITLPDSITAIGDEAFLQCSSLAHIELPDELQTIGNQAFYQCFDLTQITLPGKLTTIGENAFAICAGLEKITIPASVTTIEASAFSMCRTLSEVLFEGDAPSIGTNAFSNVTAACYYYADKDGWTEDVKQNYGGTLTWIGTCKVHNFNDQHVCSGCGLIGGTFGTNHTWTLIDGVLSIKGSGAMGDYADMPWYMYRQQITAAIVDEGTTVLGSGLFQECSNLVEVTLPDSLTAISGYAFSGCTSLKEITLPDSITAIGNRAFADCTALESIRLPAGMTTIAADTFNGASALSQVVLPENLSSIGDKAFFNCHKLNNISFPATLTSIGEGAFTYCASLTSVKLPEELDSIGIGAFEFCNTLAEVVLPGGLRFIGQRAFNGCTGLTEISIPQGITELSAGVFYGCTALASVTLPADLNTIGSSAFYACQALKQIEIPENVSSIEDLAFAYTGLSKVTFAGNAPAIGNEAFFGVIAECHYYADKDGWTEDVKKHYGGTLTWIATCGDHVYEETGIVYTWAEDNTSCTAQWNCTNEGCQIVKANETVTATEVNIPAACETDGSITYTAAFTTEGLKTQTKFITIPAIGHSYNTVVTDPTCTEDGYITYTCSKCGDAYTEDGETALGHDMGEQYTVEEATCTTDGKLQSDCSRCDHSEIQVIEATGHSYDAVVTDPTCTEDGYTTYTCSKCGDSYTEAGEAALDHEWSKWKITATATCTEDGELRRDCGRCGHFEAEPIEATGHAYETAQTAPTCTEDGYLTYTCNTCGHSYSEVTEEKLGHAMGKWSITKMATCTEEGELRRSCSRCDYFEAEPIEATGHDYTSVVTDPTCTEQGYTTHTCACGDSFVDTYVDALGHAWDEGVVTTEPTEETEGEMTYTCLTCGETRTEVIPVVVPEYSVTYTNASISLAGDIGVNYYATLSEDLIASEGAYMQFTVAGKTQTVPVSEAEVDANGVYRFSCKVAAKQMTDTIVGQMYLADGTAVGEAKPYSVKAYCDAAIPVYGQYAAYAKLVDLMEAMLNYGAYSQIQLNYNTGNLANAGLSDTSLPTITEADVTAYAHGATGSESGISVASVSLLLESNTTIRFYFQLDGTRPIDQYTFYVDGIKATPVQSGENMYYVDKVNVAAKDLDQMATVTVGGLTAKYCGLSYVRQVAVLYPNYYNANLVNVAKALYAYNQAANAYFG